MEKLFWLTYDLGIDGDYDSLFTWLDELGAVECGDGACSFKLEVGSKEPPAAVTTALRKNKVKLRPKDRIYLIWRSETGSVKGRFIAGNRRRAPWAGYAVESSEETEDASD